jgi:hypothetical protein
LLVDYLENGRTIVAKYCVALLNKLNKQLVTKHGGKLLKRLLFLLSYKMAITHQKLTDFHFEVQKGPAYSRDVACLDYSLFRNLNKHFKGRKFSSI